MKWFGYLILITGLTVAFLADGLTSTPVVVSYCAFILSGTTLIVVDRIKPRIKDNK